MRYLVVVTIALVSLLEPRSAAADASAAARAFNEGQAAQLDGDYDRAAQAFELAFSIAPSKEALRSAVRARHSGGHLARAAMLAELLRAQYASDLGSVSLAEEIINQARPKLGRVKVACNLKCSAVVGGRSLSIAEANTHVLFVNPGALSLEIVFGRNRTARRDVTVKAGDDLDLSVTAPPPPKEKPSDEAIAKKAKKPKKPSGVSPVVPAVGAALTLGLGGAALWSGLDTNKAHDAYVKAPTNEGWEDGRSKQLRTNILLGATAGVGVATAVTAIFFTKWGRSNGERRRTAVVTPAPGGVSLGLAGRF